MRLGRVRSAQAEPVQALWRAQGEGVRQGLPLQPQLRGRGAEGGRGVSG